MPSSYDYDVIVLGAGPGGYVAAIRSAQLGLKTALIEKENLGGVCLNWGCIPSKSLIRNAEIVQLLGRGQEFGFQFDNLRVDFGVAVKRSRQNADRLVKGVNFLMKKNQVTVIQGTGSLSDPHTLQVEGKAYTAANIILATGGRPALLPGLTVDGRRILTYRQAIVQDALPKSLIVVGAGPIGMEFAYVYRAYGVEVTVVEMLPHVLPNEDDEVAEVVAKAFRKQGVRLFENTRTESVEVGAEGVRVGLKNQASGATETVEAAQVLVAIGIRPNSDGIGLEAAGVQANERGWLSVDSVMRTNVPHIYAIGDLTGKLALAHVASAQGIVIIEDEQGDAPDKRPGEILEQDPPPGTILVAREIRVVVAKAKEDIKIPSVVGKTLDEARGELEGLGFEVPEVIQQDSNKTPGTVLGQEPKAGGKAPSGTDIKLTVASLPMIEVPKVTGKYLRTAKSDLQNVGLEVTDVRRVEHAEHGEGYVLKQDPPAGTKVPFGTDIKLTVVAPN